MIVRSEFLLAMLPPAIAVSWVVVDATTGLVAADRNRHVAEPVVQIVSELEIAAFVDAGQHRAPIVICTAGSIAGEPNIGTAQYLLPHSTLQRLCRAGLKFTSSLPKT